MSDEPYQARYGGYVEQGIWEGVYFCRWGCGKCGVKGEADTYEHAAAALRAHSDEAHTEPT